MLDIKDAGYLASLSPMCNQTAALDDETADMFKNELLSRIQMLDIIQKALMGAGVAIFVLCLVSYCVVRRSRHQTKFVWAKHQMSSVCVCVCGHSASTLL